MHPACAPRCPPALQQFVMGSLAMKATERDPDFLANFGKAVGGNKRKTSEALAGFAGLPVGWGLGSFSLREHSAGSCPPPTYLAHQLTWPPTNYWDHLLDCSHRGLRSWRHAGHCGKLHTGQQTLWAAKRRV